MDQNLEKGPASRSSFTGKIGFVLAAAGSAVGLGNIWRFPYLAAKYGGGIFLLTYIILSVTFGFSLMVAEIAIGRKTNSSPINAFKALDKRFAFLGYLAAAVPAIILPYYSVIGGWVMEMLGKIPEQGDTFTHERLTVTVAETEGHSASWVDITLAPEETEEEEEE